MAGRVGAFGGQTTLFAGRRPAPKVAGSLLKSPPTRQGMPAEKAATWARTSEASAPPCELAWKEKIHSPRIKTPTAGRHAGPTLPQTRATLAGFGRLLRVTTAVSSRFPAVSQWW